MDEAARQIALNESQGPYHDWTLDQLLLLVVEDSSISMSVHVGGIEYSGLVVPEARWAAHLDACVSAVLTEALAANAEDQPESDRPQARRDAAAIVDALSFSDTHRQRQQTREDVGDDGEEEERVELRSLADRFRTKVLTLIDVTARAAAADPGTIFETQYSWLRIPIAHIQAWTIGTRTRATS